MKRPLYFVAFALMLGAVVWFLRPRHDKTSSPPRATATARTPASVPSPLASRPAPALPPVEVSHLADQLNSPAGDIRADLRILDECLANYRTNFARDGNPVGSNAEITAALTGKNKLRYAVIPPNHPAINRDGELCDRWGTPFFFHAESGTRMTIRSAGPDRKMWTADDLEFAP